MTRVAPGLPDWTVGDRQLAFSVLLVEARTVWAAVPPGVEAALAARYPRVVALAERDGRVVARDDLGALLPPPDLVVVDESLIGVESVQDVMPADAMLAVLGRSGTYRVHPDLDRPELVWRPGWPVPLDRGPMRWARRALALRLRRTTPRLRVEGGLPSVADDVVASLGTDRDGEHPTLAGVVTAGHTVLRVRTGSGDLAVRLTLGRGDRLEDPVDAVVADVPEVAAHLPQVVARGQSCGHDWVAHRWLPDAGLWSAWGRASLRRRVLAESVVATLETRPTGSTGPGWAEEWCRSALLVPERLRRRLVTALRPLESGLPTSWCHGDLWPGNLLLGRAGGAVIDWDNAVRDAIQGIDRVLLPVLGPHAPRRPSAPEQTVCGRLLALAAVEAGPGAPPGPVGGRPWAEWSVADREALALATCVLYLRNRSELDLGPEQLARELAVLEQHLDAPTPGASSASVVGAESSTTAPAEQGEAERTARGAVWLGTGSVVVKTSQTVVLLTLAALLAPSALGLVALGTLVANVAAITANLGTANALVYWRGDVERAARTAVTVALASGGLLAALLWVAAPWLAATFRADGGTPVIRGLTIVLPCVAVAAVTGELLRRRLAFRRRILPDVVASVAGAIVAIALAVEGVGVMSLVVGQVVQGVLTLLVAWLVHPPVLPGWNRADARGLLGYGGPVSGASLLELVQLNLDYLFVSRVLGALALGLYSLAFRLAYLPHLMVVIVITGAAFPYLCRRTGPEFARAAERVAVTTLSLVLPLCLGIVLLAEHLVVLGDKWTPAVPVVRWLGVYALALAVGQIVQVTLNSFGRPGLSLCVRLAQLLGLLVALPMAVEHGIEAVGVAQVVVTTAVAVLAGILAVRTVPGLSTWRMAAGLRAAVAGGAAMALVVLGSHLVIPADPGSFLDLLARGCLALTAYVVTVAVLDRDSVRNLRDLLVRKAS